MRFKHCLKTQKHELITLHNYLITVNSGRTKSTGNILLDSTNETNERWSFLLLYKHYIFLLFEIIIMTKLKKAVSFMPKESWIITHDLDDSFIEGGQLLIKKYLTVDEARMIEFDAKDGFVGWIRMVVKSIVDWNLHDDDWNKRPITYDIVKQFPLWELNKLLNIVSKWNNVKIPWQPAPSETE